MASKSLASKNINALPSPASGAKVMKLAISSFEGNIAGRLRIAIENFKSLGVAEWFGTLHVMFVMISIL